jgi:hypothetical protein
MPLAIVSLCGFMAGGIMAVRHLRNQPLRFTIEDAGAAGHDSAPAGVVSHVRSIDRCRIASPTSR